MLFKIAEGEREIMILVCLKPHITPTWLNTGYREDIHQIIGNVTNKTIIPTTLESAFLLN